MKWSTFLEARGNAVPNANSAVAFDPAISLRHRGARFFQSLPNEWFAVRAEYPRMELTYEARSSIVSVAPTNQTTAGRTPTLGEFLYADPTIADVSEKEWLALVRAISAGDQAALRTLSDKTFPVVFTYLMRLTGNRHLTDTLILDVFQMVWCEAPVFDTSEGPVLGWIMRQARSLALTHAGSGRSARGDSGHDAMDMSADPVPSGDDDFSSRASAPLQRALEALTVEERQAIEATLLNGLSYSEFATQCGQPIGTIKGRIRSGWATLQYALRARGEDT
ncbi:RNA polymerase sigma factor [Steroidobacter agaridevorans]|nr:sigma factor-like helix-turn-helix DNA-binding protein [Steroidobacter agaridevorans]